MKALVKSRTALYVGEHPDPVLSSDKDVIVRVALTGICRTDLYVADGRIPGVPSPLVLGHEFSGIVEQTGAAVAHVAPGDRVTAMPLLPTVG